MLLKIAALGILQASADVGLGSPFSESDERVARLEERVAELTRLLERSTDDSSYCSSDRDGATPRMLFQKSMGTRLTSQHSMEADDVASRVWNWESALKLLMVLGMVVGATFFVKVLALFNPKPYQMTHETENLLSDGELKDSGNLPMIIDNMTYHMGWLKTWSVFNVATRTVWKRGSLWAAMGRLAALTTVTAGMIYMEGRYLTKGSLKGSVGNFDAMKFSEINSMLNMFVTLMLSFFLSLSVNRWSGCVNAYLGLVNSIKNLSMQMLVLGANEDSIDSISRFGLLSGVFLSEDMRNMELAEKDMHKDKMWEALEKGAKSRLLYVTSEERQALEPIQDCAAQMWIWVGSLIGRLAQDGEIPGMATPTYGRIMQLAQDGQESIRQVRASVLVRLPFIYMHMLSTLVQVNNIFFALTLGFTLGALFVRDTEVDEGFIQVVIVSVLKCVICPLLYQACLELGISIAEPFAYGDGRIPILGMLMKLDRDLKDARTLAEKPPSWEVPVFKNPSKRIG